MSESIHVARLKCAECGRFILVPMEKERAEGFNGTRRLGYHPQCVGVSL